MTIYLPQPRGTDPVVYRWMQAVTKALGSTDTVTPIDPSGFLPATTTVQGIGALGFSGTLAEGTVLITLKPLDDSGLGTLLKITRDIYGRVSGTQEATAADLAYDPTTSGLSATDVQAAIDSIVSGVAITVSDTAPAFPVNGQGWVDTTDGTFYIWYDDGTSAAWVAFGSAGGGGAATDITYDNSTSGLAATDVQAALDELAGDGSTPTGTGFRHVTSGTEDAVAVTIDGQSTLASGDVKVIAPATHAATSKTTPVDADELPLVDTAASNVLKKLTLTNLKAYLKTYFDALYAGGSAWTLVKKSSDETRISTTTFADDGALSMALAASTKYNIRAWVYYTTVSPANFKYQAAYTGTLATMRFSRTHTLTGAATGTANITEGHLSGSLPATAIISTSGSAVAWFAFDLYVETSTAGTFSIQWAQNTSTAANTIVHAGSYLEYATF